MHDLPRPSRADIVTVAVGVVAAILYRLSGQQLGLHDALIEMGFDPDRAQLLTALAAGAVTAGLAGLVTGRRSLPAVLGLGVALWTFRSVFTTETAAALHSGGSQGSFSPTGWLLTLLGLIGVAGATGWASATLAGEIRAPLLDAWRPRLANVRLDRSDPRGLSPLALPASVTAAALVAAIVATSVFGDMVNYSPDADMRAGGPAGVPLAGGASAGGSAGASSSGSNPDTAALGAAATTWTSPAKPWLAWVPSGTGHVDHLTFPSPWTGGRSSTADVWVYVPPGYAGGTRHYPVMYQAPWTLNSWEHGAQITATLDRLMTSGRIPPEIVVFIGQGGGPYIWSECVDSFDGREHFETYIVSTVVPAIDARYRTIAEPAARSLFGFSDGGFCAPMLALRHPDVFAASVSFSGYFQAALRANQTVNAWRPFGSNATLIEDHSPILLASRVTRAVRDHLFIVLVGDPSEGLYGPQLIRFDQALSDAGIPRLVISDTTGHSWIEVRDHLPDAFGAIAAREVALGVFAR